MNRRQMLATTVAGAATIAISGGESFAQRVPTVADVLYDKEIPVLGNPNGNVTIVEYFDYQCPYCKKVHPTVEKVVKADGNVRLVLKDWPILGEAEEAGRLCRAGALDLFERRQDLSRQDHQAGQQVAALGFRRGSDTGDRQRSTASRPI